LLGLVRHMIEVENIWFGNLAGAPKPPRYFSLPDNPDGEFDDVADADAAANVATFLAECEDSRRIAAAHDLDDTFVRRDETFSLRWLYLHMIEEDARHIGHADIIRQRIDGATVG